MTERFDTSPSHSTLRRAKAAHRNELELTTPEWLLLTSAVASLAALAVVLVAQTVDKTGEQLANPDRQITAANHAAAADEQPPPTVTKAQADCAMQ